ncbi:phosphatidate cytidylyltransferase [Metamycoplasma canadense]|uniref:Phosphatidate cytidylyltransferase n=1 Tax=Metamycoplasma canadense TaxID=29554 RepID=A0A077L5X2_9BACT|nr:phosphatidate cytidylyltransferase [Metamycoplasma canadense]BAP39397.1 phosphatidate cytidylyltransferase [Metamycoplasma canadense]
MKNISQRIKSALILLTILLPFLFITYYGKISGKIIGISFFTLISVWATYEVLSHSILARWQNILISILSILIWAFPLDWFSNNTQSNNIFIHNANKIGFNIEELILQLKKAVFFSEDSLTSFKALSVICLVTLISLIYLFNLFFTKKSLKEFIVSYIVAIFSTIFIPISFKTLFLYNSASLYFIFAIISIPVVTDTSAYIGGSLFGRKIIKVGMAPKISPKKSWEGGFIGFIFGSLFVFITMYLGKLTNNLQFIIFSNWKQLLVGIILLPFISIIGDLAFSLIKRLYGVKDFSNLIPGHGGFMDRFDSSSFVVIGVSVILLIR